MPLLRAPLFALCLSLAAGRARAGAAAAPQVPAARPCPAPGTPAPPFSFPLPPGDDRVSLNALKAKKRPIVLAFWAWNCGPCILEMPALQKLAAEWGDGVSVLLVHVGESEEKLRDALDRWSIKLPSAIDASAKKSGEEYCASALPRLYVLDAQGTVRAALGALGDKFESTVRGEVAKVVR